jgi:hypothetical protein
VPLAVEGGDLAYGLGDGREVLTQDRTAAAGDFVSESITRAAEQAREILYTKTETTSDCTAELSSDPG